MLADVFLYILGAVGHIAIWVSIYNRVQAFVIERWMVKLQEKFCVFACGLIGVIFVWRCVIEGASLVGHITNLNEFWTPLWYLIPCWGVGLLVLPAWLARRHANRRPRQLIDIESIVYDVPAETGMPLKGEGKEAFLNSLPWNETLLLNVTTKTIELPNWPQQLQGLRIAHLSDIHFTGYIRKEYFEFACGKINDLNADLIVVSGDILDKRKCLDWIPDTLGTLQAKHGVYFVLGNHDRMHPEPLRDELKQSLQDAGLHHVGGSWRSLEINVYEMIIAGNESPWFLPPPDMSDCPERENGPPRLLVAHTPDVINWGKQHDFDLMLAGHTHGGQIRLPIYGPLVAPSLYGVLYASGEFFVDTMFMHVSRGLSGQHPIRYNCPPEVSLLVINGPT